MTSPDTNTIDWFAAGGHDITAMNRDELLALAETFRTMNSKVGEVGYAHLLRILDL